jgi:hypothetical protein
MGKKFKLEILSRVVAKKTYQSFGKIPKYIKKIVFFIKKAINKISIT